MSEKRCVNRDIQEWRRLRAVELHHLGWWEVDIAAALGVHKGTVSKWLTLALQEGTNALLAHPVSGPPTQTDHCPKAFAP